MRPSRTRALPVALLIVPCLSAVAAPLSAQVDGRAAARSARVKVATARDLGEELLRKDGNVRITVIYGTRCPNSQAMFADLGSLTRRYGHRGVDFLAYSRDDPEDLSEVPAFLRRYGARVEHQWLEPGAPGELSEAVGSIGVPMGSRYTLPLVIIQDATGELVWSGQGVRSLDGLDRWLDQAIR